ncbi:MAG: hypothetical protein H6706_04885 [Myxococcales bacterium]|nr:hypothetical protein [Myxococcales bacterium]
MRAPWWWLVAVLALVACDDDTGAGGGPGPGADAQPADAAGADAGPTDAGADVALPDAAPPEPPGFVELRLSPQQAVYGLADQPQVEATVFDRVGQPLDGAALVWRVVEPVPMPEGPIATLDAEHRLTFLREGPGSVRACIGENNAQICGRVSFFVDAGPPALVVEVPARGAFVDVPEIEVRGHTDVGARVFVNDAEVAVGADGAFETVLPARFGLNRVDVLADDGVRRPAPRVVREVVHAPVLIPASPEGVRLADMLAVRLGQALLDRDAPPPDPDEAGVVHLDHVAGMVEAFLARVEPMGFIADPVLADGAELSLRIVGAGPGEPDATLRFTEGGIEVFLRLEGLSLQTEGRVDLEGVPVDLTGTIRVTAAAFALAAIEAGPDGTPGLRLTDVGVAIESLGGEMVDSTAQAVLDTLGSIVRAALQGAATDLVDELVRQAVPGFIELGLGDALEPLADIPVEIAASDLLPAIALRLGMTLREPEAHARDGLALFLDGAVGAAVPVEPPHPFPGVPAHINEPPPWPAAGGLVFAIRLATVNALAHELWRQGLLQLDVSAVIPENFRALVSAAVLDAHLPPVVVATPPGSPDLLEMQIGDVDVALTRPGAPAPDRYAMSLRARVGVEPGEGGIRLRIAEDFDLRLELVEAGSAAPFAGDGLEALLRPLLLEKVRELLVDGFDLSLDPVVIGRDAYAAYAPGISELRFAPAFPEPPFVREGWIMVPVDFAFDLTEAR